MLSFGKGLLLLGLLLCCSSVSAIRMVPIVAEVRSDGAPVEQSFRVDNPSGNPAAVEISVLKRSTSLEGEEIRQSTGDEFVIFPEQMVLMPGESQLVRIQWLGKTQVVEEMAYRVIAEELPVDFSKEQQHLESGPKLSLLMRYEGMLYIQPPQGRAHVELVSFRIVDHEGEQYLELVLVNSGNVHVVMAEPRVSFGQRDSDGDSISAEIREQLNVNMLAREKRRFLLPWPDGLDPDALDVQFNYQSAD
jgi:fimbrial chaperone protein